MPTEREDCEAAFRSLIGYAVASAVYMGAWTNAPSEPEAYIEWVELTTVEGALFRITTEPDFGDYGLVILEGAVDRNDALKIFDATRVLPWNDVVGSRVVAAKVLWRPLMYPAGAAYGGPPEYPRDAVLRFDNGRVLVLSAATLDQHGDIALGVDTVAAFGEDQARALGILDQSS